MLRNVCKNYSRTLQIVSFTCFDANKAKALTEDIGNGIFFKKKEKYLDGENNVDKLVKIIIEDNVDRWYIKSI